MPDSLTEVVVLATNGHPERVPIQKYLWIRFTLPNGAEIDVRHIDGILEINGVNTGPLAIEPRVTNSIHVSARTAFDHQMAREPAATQPEEA